MRPKRFIAIILAIILLGSVIPACTPVSAAASYTAVIPKVWHSGGRATIALTLLDGQKLVSGNVEVSLLKEGERILKVKKNIEGKGTIEFDVPQIAEGNYEVQVKAGSFEGNAQVRVESQSLLFLESDKPIYKPGQTMHLRVITLDADLKPVKETVTLEVLDAKGTKVFRQDVGTDDYGMVTLDFPISTEPNLGVWKVIATAGKEKTQFDVRVEEYVLPKYEVTPELAREWWLVSEQITGKVKAEYSFGKPVKGELEITASRYVGRWEKYATFSKPIDGEIDFSLPAVGYVAGTPASGGMGNVMLEFKVEEKATGYEEKTTRLLTVSSASLNIKLVLEGSVFKPGLPFRFLVVTQTPDNKVVDSKVSYTVTYLDSDFKEGKQDKGQVTTRKGKALIEITPPENNIALIIECSSGEAYATRTIEASYSPSGNFIHLEQTSEGTPRVGDEVKFRVYSTERAVNFYYEVVSRGRVVFTDYTSSPEIAFDATPMMAPSARLLVYQILPNSEVAADYLPFQVEAGYPNAVDVQFSKDEVKPGEEVGINIETEGQAKVGIVAVDKSVFILAENRLNLQQVFDELERLFMEPQAELHEVNIYSGLTTKGAQEIFADAGVVVLSNNKLPEGKKYEGKGGFGGGIIMAAEGRNLADKAVAPTATPTPAPSISQGLAEVERVRQYFPETWLWTETFTDASGHATMRVQVPDSITTWMLRAVAMSKDNGLGIAEDELKTFQPFFISIDLPYSAIRGEEFPVKVVIYNYLLKPQSVQVQIEKGDWFDLLDESEKRVEIAASDISSAQFKIKPNRLGNKEVKITVRGQDAADAVIKTLIVEPEGVSRETVSNLVISAGVSKTIETLIPPETVLDSGRAYFTLTAGYLTQTLEGLEALIQMPFGCGEQNMILFAPDVYITRYLKESGQLKPEIMAKAEKLMLTGYQREMMYRRSDGSFSAFGNSDKEGSLWLTAFVLKCFSQAKGLVYIDESVLEKAASWITSHQNNDGSYDPVGFVHHQEMLGGLTGKTALTAYVAIALMEAKETASSAKAVAYLEGELNKIEDAYTLAITTYALEFAGSGQRDAAYQKLMAKAKEDENGLHWGEDVIKPEPLQFKAGAPMPSQFQIAPKTAQIETTAYATLALVKHKDALNASKAAKWLVSKRNAYGGYGSTQDTVVTLQALVEQATGMRADVDLRVSLKTADWQKELRIGQSNFDVLQIVELPVNDRVEVTAEGRGEAIAQVVTRYNVPQAEKADEILKIKVDYDSSEVEVNDLVTVSAELQFDPPVPMEAGMVVLDISVPTGFTPVTETIAQAIQKQPKIKRYDIAGRKVVFYIENMQPGEKVSLSFKVKAMYPVKAKGVTSQAYSYYKPEIKGETLGKDITVN